MELFIYQMARIHQRHDMDRSSMLFGLIKTPAPDSTSLSFSTGRVSLAVPLFVHGFFFAVWHLHRLTNGTDSVSQAEMEFACKSFLFQRCDPNVFVSLALVLLHPCQSYPVRAASVPPHDEKKHEEFSICLQYSPSFRHFQYTAWVEKKSSP